MDQDELTKFGPPDDTPILPWYGGAFQHAFVALHPFFSVEGLHPGACESGSLVLLRSEMPDGAELLEWADEAKAARKLGKEIEADAVDTIAKRFGRTIGWQAVARAAGFSDHCELDRALRTNIHGLRDDLADSASTERLLRYCDREALFLPTEGRFEPVMQSALIQMFARAGHCEIIAGDEFGNEERLVDLSALAGKKPWVGVEDVPAYGARRLFAPDRSLLAWVHWDSFYTLILGTEAGLAGIRLNQLFEGFWCDTATTTYWLTEPPIPLVE